MKKIKSIFSFAAAVVICAVLSGCGVRQAVVPEPNAEIYYIDHELLTLIPVPTFCEGADVQAKAECVLDKLREGQDFNRKIKRQIPDLENGMSVKVTGSTACVNLSGEFVQQHPDGRIPERLTVYQIVNSLTSIDGLDSVCFMIDNKVTKKFKGFMDMREMFYYKEHVY